MQKGNKEEILENDSCKGLEYALYILCVFFVRYKLKPRREKTGFLHMRKQRRRSASR